MIVYLPLDIICSLKVTAFLELRLWNCSLLGTDNVHGQIFQHIFSDQTEALIYLQGV